METFIFIVAFKTKRIMYSGLCLNNFLRSLKISGARDHITSALLPYFDTLETWAWNVTYLFETLVEIISKLDVDLLKLQTENKWFLTFFRQIYRYKELTLCLLNLCEEILESLSGRVHHCLFSQSKVLFLKTKSKAKIPVFIFIPNCLAHSTGIFPYIHFRKMNSQLLPKVELKCETGILPQSKFSR